MVLYHIQSAWFCGGLSLNASIADCTRVGPIQYSGYVPDAAGSLPHPLCLSSYRKRQRGFNAHRAIVRTRRGWQWGVAVWGVPSPLQCFQSSGYGCHTIDHRRIISTNQQSRLSWCQHVHARAITQQARSNVMSCTHSKYLLV